MSGFSAAGDRRARQALTWGPIALVVLIEAGLLAGRGDLFARLVSDIALPASALAAAAACAFAARRHHGRFRAAWALLAGAMSMALIGALLVSLRNLLTDAPGGDPAAGPFYLGAIVLSLAALALLPLLPKGGLRGLVVVLDGLVLACSLFIVSWSFALEPLYREASGSLAERLLPVIYLGGTIALFVLALFQLSAARGDLRSAAVLTLSMLALAVTNAVYLPMSLTGGYASGSPIDAGWPLSFLLVGATGLLAQPDRVQREQVPKRVAAVLASIPYVVALAAVASGGLQVMLAHGVISPPRLVIAALMASFLCLRLLVSQRDQRSLIDDLAAAKDRLEDVLDAAPVAVFTLDGEGRILLARGPLATALGLREGAHDARIDLPEALREAALEGLGGRASQLHVRIDNLDLDVRLRPATEPGPARLFGIAIDVSEQRRAEAAMLESAAKTRFLAQMSHELRTPLNSVLGFTQMLQMGRDPLTERQSRWLGNVRSSADHLLALINDVLDLTKVAAGQVAVEVEPLDVAVVVARAVSKVRPLAAERDLVLSAAIDDSVVLADDRRLEQVILNLLSNAIKFTPRGGSVRVKVSPAGGEVRIDVVDNGIGIRPEDQHRIFDEFTQVSDGRTRTEEGTGLGLALSRRLCDLMGARLELESEPGRGSRFTVVLRAAEAPAAVTA